MIRKLLRFIACVQSLFFTVSVFREHILILLLSPVEWRMLTFGSAVEVTGTLKKSPHKKQPVELEAAQIHIVGECNPVVRTCQTADSLWYIVSYLICTVIVSSSYFRTFPLKSKRGTALSIFVSFLISGVEQMPLALCWGYEVRPLQQFTCISRWEHQWRSLKQTAGQAFFLM